MKKLALALVAALPMAFVACNSDDDEVTTVTLDQTSSTLEYAKEMTLKASEKGVEWESSNEFVATVDKDGKVTAKHVGEAVISASKDGSRATCKVTVAPTNNDFTMPLLLWDATQSEIQTRIPSSLNLSLVEERSDEDVLAYTTIGGTEGLPWYIYYFENNALAASNLTVDIEEDDNFSDFLDQYYEILEGTDYETENNIVYADGYNLSSANVAVLVEPDEDFTQISAIWRPVEHTKSAKTIFNNDVLMRLREVRKSLKK